MSNLPIHFEELNWIPAATGIRYKEYIYNDQRMRLAEFSEGFVEEDWCTKGHVGLVVEGSMKIDFNGEVVSYQKGDGLWISEGNASKHKVLMEKGGRALLFLVETL